MAKRNTQSDVMTDIGVNYDLAHLSGDEDVICAHEEMHDNGCFAVDWRGEFEEMLDEINHRFTDRQFEFVQPAAGYKVAVCCGKKKASTRSLCRMEVLKAIDKVLRGAHEEMRCLVDSLASDTFVVMVKPVPWWKAMDKHFPADMKKTYVKLKDVNIR